MTKKERQIKILESIQLNKEINVKALATLINVSEMTIRRDLKELESLESESLSENYNMISAIKSENSHKEKIGKEASKLLKENDVIFIDTGSTSVQMVDHILDLRNLSVQTCNVEVLSRIAYNQITNVYFAGGFLHAKSQMCESKENIDFLKRNKSEYAFITAAGVDKDLGLTCANYYEVETKQTVMNNTKKTVLLVDSSKFDHVASAFFAELSEVDLLITDNGISKEWIKHLKTLKIELIIAS